MLRRTSYRTYQVECDNCGELLETDEPDFYGAVQVAKQNDWGIRKVEERWTHTCPECLESEVDGLAS